MTTRKKHHHPTSTDSGGRSSTGGAALAPLVVPPRNPVARLKHSAFLSVCTKSGGTRSRPIGIGSLIPVGTAGFDVHEPLHRLDASLVAPTLERGIASGNRTGEALGTVTMRWLVAPDGFEATPSSVPPATELRAASSQRFVIRDGFISFQERGEGAIRFFGAGRTYPVTANNQSRLLFAGTALVIGGFGSLKSVRGTLMLSGEIRNSTFSSLVVVGLFDTSGPIAVEDGVGALLDGGDLETGSTLLVVAGAGGAHDADEQLASARLTNDIPNATRLRSRFRAGDVIGRASGRVAFDMNEQRCAVPLAMTRELVFTDRAGRRIGTIAVSAVEGTSQREVYDGVTANRTAGYAPIAGGTGALAGASGVLTFDSAIDDEGTRSSLYVIRLLDGAGAYRAAVPDVYRAAAPRRDSASAERTRATVTFVETGAGTVTDIDRAIVGHADDTLADGMELARWWEAKDRAGDYAERFDIVREYNPSDRSFGFFDTATVGGSALPVMGMVQEMFYDRQKMAPGETIRAQLKEFVLRYFMRVSHYRQPEAAPADERRAQSALQRAISWLPDDENRRVGFGFQQLYYKLHDSGKIGKFAATEQGAIVDLRDIGRVYDWIVLKVDIFDFNLSFAPFGPDAMKVQLPLKESSYLVLGPGFVKNVDRPRPGVLGEYGFGYAFIPYAEERGMIAYGPGHFAAAIQTVDFKVLEDGEIRVRAAFVVNRPTKIATVDVAPIDWGFQIADKMTFNLASRLMRPMKDLTDRLPLRMSGVDPISTYIWMANTFTGGLAERRFGISKSVLEKRMLVQHFMQHYEMLINSLLVWRTVADWTDEEHLPDYCRTGVVG